MSPDFEYFLRLKLYAVYSHTWWGVLYFCVPVSLLVYVLYEYVAKPQLMRFYFRETYLSNQGKFTMRSAIATIVGILIGAYSHILWDSFTHMDGWFVIRYPEFLQQTFSGIPLYNLFQHGSTLIGGCAVIIFLWYLFGKRPFYLWHQFSYLVIVLFMILFAVMVVYSQQLTLGYAVVSAIAAGAYAILLTALIRMFSNSHE